MDPSGSPTRFSHRGLAIGLGVLGLATMAFSALGLAMTFLQELMSQGFPAPTDFLAGQRAIWTVWRTHLPIWFLGGIGLIVCAVRLHRLRRGSVGLARLGCVLALAALLAYFVDSWLRAFPAMEPLFSMHPMLAGGSFRAFAAVSAVFSFAAVAVPIAVLLWGLRAKPGR